MRQYSPRPRKWAAPFILAVSALGVGCLLAMPAGTAGAGEAETVEAAAAVAAVVEPEFDWVETAVSEATRNELYEKLLEQREKISAGYPASLAGPEVDLAGAAGPAASRVAADATEFHPTPSALVISNRKNSKATSQSTLAEPVAAASGNHIVAGGNTHWEYSTNLGATWTSLSFPAGPFWAPIPCCDSDVVHVPGRGVTIFSELYINGSVTEGAIVLFVRQQVPTLSCTYTLDYGVGILPDYPHIALSNGFLYLSTNNVDLSAGVWTGSQMKRLNLDQVSDCVTATVETYTYTGAVGQRVFVPAEGATTVMYWLNNENSTQSRVFRWAENSASILSWLVGRSTSTFTNPDCRGGVGGYDFVESSTAWSITGFRIRSALSNNRYLCSYWNVGADGAHPQGHVHAACFDVSTATPTLVAEPHIFNSGFCFGYPVVTSNARGDFGYSIAYGGKAGGGGLAARGTVGIADDFTAGLGFAGTYTVTGPGDRNRSDSRYGDYFTARPFSPCNYGFIATNYGLTAGGVNSRVAIFSRGRDWKCTEEWRRPPSSVYD